MTLCYSCVSREIDNIFENFYSKRLIFVDFDQFCNHLLFSGGNGRQGRNVDSIGAFLSRYRGVVLKLNVCNVTPLGNTSVARQH